MAHDMSPMASSRVLTGAVMVVSYIPFWMRKKAPHVHSNMAWNIAEPAMMPGVTNREYGTPSISSTRVPMPMPTAARITNGSTKYQVMEGSHVCFSTMGMAEPYPRNAAQPDARDICAACGDHHSSVSFLPAMERKTSSRFWKGR